MPRKATIIILAVALTIGVVVVGLKFSKKENAVPTIVPKAALNYRATILGDAPDSAARPMITHLAIADLDQDGLNDVLACDGVSNSVRWIRQHPKGEFAERQIGEKIQGPAHASLVDMNGDGLLDVLVASMGVILPNNDRVGAVIVLENQGDGVFTNRVVQENMARVTDVRAADFNSDGRLDLAVGQFGYFEGEIQWLENKGDWKFVGHPLLAAPGTIHTPIADFNQDGRPDIAALVAQDAEEVRVFRNLGSGNFDSSTIWKSLNPAWASSGLDLADINRDGRLDLVVSNGDGFDGFVGVVPWHGVQWLENKTDGFRPHSVGSFSGAYSPVATDLDADGDVDIIAVSGFNNWRDPQAVSLMAWINDGRQLFQAIPLAHTPTHLIALAAGDVDGDGIPELVTGGFHVYPPWNHISRITLWRRQ